MQEISYSGSKSPIRKRLSKRVILFGTFFIIILALLGSVFYFVTRGNSAEQVTKSITLPDNLEPQVTEEEPSLTPEESPTPTPKPKPTAVPTKATQSDSQKASIKVVVQNGSGEAGAGGKAADILKSAGYDVVSTANADNFDYTDVTIQVKEAKKSALS